MQEPMARSQVRNLSFEKVFENHFGDYLLEEKSSKDENNTLNDVNPRKFLEFYGEINPQASISLKASMEF